MLAIVANYINWDVQIRLKCTWLSKKDRRLYSPRSPHIKPTTLLHTTKLIHTRKFYKIRLRPSALSRFHPAIFARAMNLTLSKLPCKLYMPTKLFSNPTFTLDHSSSMMTVIRTSTIVAFVFHSITPLGKRPSLQRVQEGYVTLYRPSVMKLRSCTNTMYHLNLM